MSYRCYNRGPYKDQHVLHGWNSQTGEKIVTVIPHTMTKDCQYQKSDPYNDPGCVGCRHKETQNAQDGK